MKESLGGKLKVIAQFKKGVTIGEMSLVDDIAARSATARCGEDSEFLYLSRESFEEIMKKYPKIAVKILRNLASHLSERLRQASWRLADI